MHAATLWNRVQPWHKHLWVPPGYEPLQIDSPTLMPLEPNIPPQHAKVLVYPLKPPTHGGRPVGSHPMGGRYAGGADPSGDSGGFAELHNDPIQPPDPEDLNLQSLL
ncbi:hypothetical protein EV421DRAFT_1742963 [Armillaria borealis]|uniref:Uncharacterized protein n=1 Tax=Armillaria borealis TaxID=47425 RepID=A0AA39IZ94_9AGAR|nr:hypothetical protein EV421DRAFT_1742963 [Armillaria borealis]